MIALFAETFKLNAAFLQTSKLEVKLVTEGAIFTVKPELLVAVPPGPVTETKPVVAAVGTVTDIDVEELIVKEDAIVPLNDIEVTPDKPVPVIKIVLPWQVLEGMLVIIGAAAKVIVL